MTRLVLLGGFLGAGKTTTLLLLASELAASGKRVGVLTNDQGAQLVDTELFRAAGFAAGEVRNGCFCCRLDDFTREAELLLARASPDVLLAEPVGSCTDLVATVIRPLQARRSMGFAFAPYTVVVDPLRARDALSRSGRASLSEKVTYIYRLQQMEAEAIAINKLDLLQADEREEITCLVREQFPRARVITYSARTGEGFDALRTWLTNAAGDTAEASPDVDYDVYAQGEAELAWFDARYDVAVPSEVSFDVDRAALRLASLIHERLRGTGSEIAHLKLRVAKPGGEASVVSLARGNAQPELVRASNARATRQLDLLINARVAGSAEEVRQAIGACLETWGREMQAALACRESRAFAPPRPVPTCRIAR